MFKFEETILNREGQPIAGASVTLFQAGSSTQAVLYEDDQTTLKTNPLTTDTNGFVQCKAANGKYDFEISIGGVLFRRVNGIIFDDPSESGSTGVSLSVPTAEFSVTGSPGSTLAVDKKNQNANTVWAGPSAGSPNKPGFRAIVAEDLPGATEAQAQGGTSTSTVLTPLGVKKSVGFTKYVESAPITLAASSALTFAHTLGALPVDVGFYLICATAEAGYTAGQKLIPCTNNAVAGSNRVNMLSCDATNVRFSTSDAANTFVACPAAGGAFVALTNANFKIVLWARY